MQAIGASTRMFELLDREPAIPLRRKTAPTDADARPLEGHVALEGVTFAYPTRPDVQVLRDFTLRVAPNTTVALVGQRWVRWMGTRVEGREEVVRLLPCVVWFGC